MEVIRKPQPIVTETLSLRVTAELNKEHAKARLIAQRQGIDMTAMVTKALSDVFKSIDQAGSIQISTHGSKRTQQSANGSDGLAGAEDN